MIDPLVIVPVILILLWAFIGPPIYRGGKRNNNNGFRVLLQYAADIEAKGQSPKGVWTQEVGEFRWSWLFAVPFALAASIAVNLTTGEAPAAILVGILVGALAQTFGRWATSSWDTAGHGAEIIIAEREGREGYREQEISRMLWTRPKMDNNSVGKALHRWEWLSRFMVMITSYDR